MCAGLVAAAAAPLQAAEPVVLRVVVVQTEQPDVYLGEIEKGRGLLKGIGNVSELRVWRARFAGPQAGTVVVSVEYPSLAAFAADDARAAASPEVQAWLRGLEKIRKVVSDSLYTELGGRPGS
jgi:hypothetical protein